MHFRTLGPAGVTGSFSVINRIIQNFKTNLKDPVTGDRKESQDSVSVTLRTVHPKGGRTRAAAHDQYHQEREQSEMLQSYECEL